MSEIYQSLIIREKRSKRINALIDTGASVTYIRPDIAKDIGTEKLRPIKIKVADGRIIKGWETSFIIQVRGMSEATIGIITNITDQVIIGVDFLQKRNVMLDFKKDKMKIKRLSSRRMARL